jgi:signal transduction histidine kinase
LDDARIGHEHEAEESSIAAVKCSIIHHVGHSHADADHRHKVPLPHDLSSSDPEVLRAVGRREFNERQRAECLANMQADVVKLALELLVREPDIKSFFGGLTRNMVEESDSHVCAVWLIDDDRPRCEMWMAYVEDRLYTRDSPEWSSLPFPHDILAEHLMAYKPGWTQTIEYESADTRLPAPVQEFHRKVGVNGMVVAPLVLGSATLGWLKLSDRGEQGCPGARWWRVMLIEAIARQAALALHHNRLAERSRVEERRKAILEERNRLARDIHDNLAQGFGAILMQLQAAERDVCRLPGAVADRLKTAIDLARTHMIEARRSVGALRPSADNGEDVATALKRIADLAQRTTSVRIDVRVDELPRLGDGVEREIIGIAQEALTNAVRHSRARRITMSASPVRSIGFRLSVADDGRGIARENSNGGFGMTSMHERAERIGASLTIVTAPRCGTEVVLAWDPSALPTQVHSVA